MRAWMIVVMATALWLAPVSSPEDEPGALLRAAHDCGVTPHAFYVQAGAALPAAQARAILRLLRNAWPDAEARSAPHGGTENLTLAAACAPDAGQARQAARRMANLLGRGADIRFCLTGRADGHDMAGDAQRALTALEDAPIEGLVQDNLVSLTGARVQVALRRDAQGAAALLALPLIPIDY
ncbi:MAG: hypothetical protein LBU67_06070 [Oscillospiraceae bacterium]|jgi:hypothetical protein|nr:hypothetical protein [Oscillospiraceae bacterium]